MAAGRSFLADLRVVLRGTGFRRLFAVRLASQASDGAFQVGLASLVFFSPERAATPSAAAVAAAVTVLPYTLIGPFAGVLLDVWPRRHVLLAANAVRTVLVLVAAVLVARHVVGLPLYGVALACLSVNRFFLAGLGASLPHVVPRHELVMANAVSPTCGTVSALLGAGAGYLAHTALGAGDTTDAVVLLVAGLGYAAAAGLAARISPHQLGPDQRAELHLTSLGRAARDLVADLRAGTAHVRRRRRAADALAAIGAHRLGFGVSMFALVLLCRNHLTRPAEVSTGLALLALVVGASGVGFAVAIAIGLAAPIEGLLLISLALPVLLLAAFGLGLVAQSVKICVDAIVQQEIDDRFRGRVFALYDIVFNVAFLLAAALAVAVVPRDGYSRPLYASIAVAYALTAAGYALLRRGDRSGAVLPANPHLPPSDRPSAKPPAFRHAPLNRP
jgi:MFS family permease